MRRRIHALGLVLAGIGYGFMAGDVALLALTADHDSILIGLALGEHWPAVLVYAGVTGLCLYAEE